MERTLKTPFSILNKLVLKETVISVVLQADRLGGVMAQWKPYQVSKLHTDSLAMGYSVFPEDTFLRSRDHVHLYLIDVKTDKNFQK